MWPWSTFQAQLDRIERNQFRIAIALGINREMEPAPLDIPARTAPHVPPRKRTAADVHYAGWPVKTPQSRPEPDQTTAPEHPLSPQDLSLPRPLARPTAAPLASTAPERPAVPPPAPPTALRWNA